jgi:hypothetical protein
LHFLFIRLPEVDLSDLENVHPETAAVEEARYSSIAEIAADFTALWLAEREAAPAAVQAEVGSRK